MGKHSADVGRNKAMKAKWVKIDNGKLKAVVRPIYFLSPCYGSYSLDRLDNRHNSGRAANHPKHKDASRQKGDCRPEEAKAG